MLRIGSLILLVASICVCRLEDTELNKFQENVNSKTSDDSNCPTDEDIFPCTCAYEHGIGLQMDCSHVESDSQLASVFQQVFPSNNLDRFFIQYNTHIVALDDVFNGVKFKEIYLFHVENLTFFSENLLENSRDVVRSIDIHNTNLSENSFPISQIELFPELDSLSITSCQFSVVPKLKSEVNWQFEFAQHPVYELSARKLLIKIIVKYLLRKPECLNIYHLFLT